MRRVAARCRRVVAVRRRGGRDSAARTGAGTGARRRRHRAADAGSPGVPPATGPSSRSSRCRWTPEPQIESLLAALEQMERPAHRRRAARPSCAARRAAATVRPRSLRRRTSHRQADRVDRAGNWCRTTPDQRARAARPLPGSAPASSRSVRSRVGSRGGTESAGVPARSGGRRRVRSKCRRSPTPTSPRTPGAPALSQHEMYSPRQSAPAARCSSRVNFARPGRQCRRRRGARSGHPLRSFVDADRAAWRWSAVDCSPPSTTCSTSSWEGDVEAARRRGGDDAWPVLRPCDRRSRALPVRASTRSKLATPVARHHRRERRRSSPASGARSGC